MGRPQVLRGIGCLPAVPRRAVTLRRAMLLVQSDDANVWAASVSEVLAWFTDTPVDGGSLVCGNLPAGCQNSVGLTSVRLNNVPKYIERAGSAAIGICPAIQLSARNRHSGCPQIGRSPAQYPSNSSVPDHHCHPALSAPLMAFIST